MHASTSCEGCDRSCSHASNHSFPPSEIASGRARAIPCNCMGGNTYGVSCVRRHPDFCRIDVFVIRTTIATKRRCFEVQQRRVRQELLACLNSQRRVRQELLACLKAQLSPFYGCLCKPPLCVRLMTYTCTHRIVGADYVFSCMRARTVVALGTWWVHPPPPPPPPSPPPLLLLLVLLLCRRSRGEEPVEELAVQGSIQVHRR